MLKKEPHFSSVRKIRIDRLLKRLKAEPDQANHLQIKSLFAYDYGIKIEKVEEYYSLLVDAGLITLDN